MSLTAEDVAGGMTVQGTTDEPRATRQGRNREFCRAAHLDVFPTNSHRCMCPAAGPRA